jgi:hypothetical protein
MFKKANENANFFPFLQDIVLSIKSKGQFVLNGSISLLIYTVLTKKALIFLTNNFLDVQIPITRNIKN